MMELVGENRNNSGVSISAGDDFDRSGKYLSCWNLRNYIHYSFFEHSKICCLHGRSPWIDLTESQTPLEDFLNFRNGIESTLNSGRDCICTNCPKLTYDSWGSDSRFSSIALYPSPRCNINCYYCSNECHKPLDRGYDWNDAIERLNQFLQTGLLYNWCSVEFIGGEPMFIPGFDNCVNYILDYMSSPIFVTTNSSIFSPAVARGLRAGRIVMRTSLDAGTRETFKAIKGCDLFDTTVSAIGKYAECSPSAVRVKYIILPENRNNKDCDAFLRKMREFGLFSVEIDFNIFDEPDSSSIESFIFAGQFIAQANKLGLDVNCEYKFVLDEKYKILNARQLIGEAYRTGISDYSYIRLTEKSDEYYGELTKIYLSDSDGIFIEGIAFDSRLKISPDEIAIFFGDMAIFVGVCRTVNSDIHKNLNSVFSFKSPDVDFAEEILSKVSEIRAYARFGAAWYCLESLK